jgi:hypothetical protein
MQRTTIAILSILVATFIAAKSYAEEVLVVKEQPPLPKVEVVGNPPNTGWHWAPGYWRWENSRWVWIAGKWVQPPHPSAFWEPDVWAWRPYGWVHRPGRWVY